ncbi:hypothetical protein BBP40_002783 [Aspergillus hancockii]|nr:hypothetical protein BBP40_002783 [Aspergillus hancockii]
MFSTIGVNNPKHRTGSLGSKSTFEDPLPVSTAGEALQQGTIITDATTKVQPASRDHAELSKAQPPGRRTSTQSPSEDRKALRGAFANDRFFGQSHYLNSVYQFPRVYDFIFKLEADTTGDAHSKYQTCKRLAKMNHNTRPLHQIKLRDHIPPRNIAETLVYAFVRTFESVFRILHVPTFLHECNNYFTTPETASDEFMITLMLVMSIGIGLCPEITGWTARAWIQSAQTWLGPPTEKSRVNIPGVQNYCLLLLAKQINNVEVDFICISVAALLQLAMQTGLHIDPSLLPGLSFFDQEIRRRLWATVLEITIQSTMDSGGLPLIPIEEIDYQPPLNLADEQFDQDTQTAPSPSPPEVFTRTSTQIALMQSFELRLKIAWLVNSLRRECPYERALQLSAELSSYYQENTLRPETDAVPEHVLQSLTFSMRLFELLMLRFLLALHQPFIIKARKDPTFYFSRKVSLEVSLSLLTRTFLSGNPGPGEKDYCRLALIGTGMFFNVTGQAAITVCEDVIGQLEEGGSPIMSVFSSISYHNLRTVIEEYNSLLSARLRTNETTVRGYLMFVGLLAHIDALQSGMDVQQEIDHALTDALDHCYRALTARGDESRDQRLDLSQPPNPQRREILPALDDLPTWIESDEMVGKDCAILIVRFGY